MVTDTDTRSADPAQLSKQAGLPPYVIEKLQSVLRGYPTVERASLYGSRAKGNFRPASDIDLSLHGQNISWEEFQAAEREIDDLLLPWKVDLSIYHQIENDSLKDHIDRVGVELWSR